MTTTKAASPTFCFTGQEHDPETGLYYYGARYLDPKTSRWLGVDPAMGEYVPGAGGDPGRLPGMGGVFNYVNMHVYHYGGNNPVKYDDPDGRIIKAVGEDGTTYTWDNERNEFYSGFLFRKYGTDDAFIKDVSDSLVHLKGSEYGQEIIGAVSGSRNVATVEKTDGAPDYEPRINRGSAKSTWYLISLV
jgi:RHS repeat-associated protein